MASVVRRKHARSGEAIEWLRAHVQFAGDDCLIWPYSRRWNGYGQVQFNNQITYPHRVMCRLAHGEPPSAEHVAAHSCHNGRGGCVNPRHLSWKTPRENLLERREAGTLTRKRWNNKGSLTRDQVHAIKKLRGIINQREIATRFGISYQHVSYIQNNRLVRGGNQ